MTTPLQVPDSIKVVNTDPDAIWALPAVQQALRLCGQIRRLTEAEVGAPLDIEFVLHGLKGAADAAFALFTNGEDEPKTLEELEPYLTQTFSAAAYALAIGTALLEMSAEIKKGAADV